MTWDRQKLAIEVVETFVDARAVVSDALPSYTDAINREYIYNKAERRAGMASIGVEWWAKLIKDAIQRRNARTAHERSARGKQAAQRGEAYRAIKNDPEKLEAYRARKREEARRRRQAARTACDYAQLNLPFLERITMREKLPADRVGVTQKFTIITKDNDDGGVREIDIYLTANTYPADYVNEARRGQLGEVLIRIGKAGHTEAIYGEWAKTTSHSLQHGISVDDLFRKHVGTRFDPHGATTHPVFKRCTSPLDLVSRWILSRYGSPAAKEWIASMQNNNTELQP